MSIRSKKSVLTPTEEAPVASDILALTEEQTPEPTEEEKVAKAKDAAKVQAAAKLASSQQAVYRLLTPYTIVAPNGIRFLPGEPTPAPVTPWMESNVKAKIFEVVKK